MLLSPIVPGHCQGQILCYGRILFPTLTGITSAPARSRALQLREQHPMRHSTPHLYHVTVADSVWALPFSSPPLAESRIDFFSSYSDASLDGSASPKEKQGSVKRDLIRKSRINGRMHFPRLIAAHVLHRLPSRVIPQPASSHYTSTPFFF